jgi:hypothetical protein
MRSISDLADYLLTLPRRHDSQFASDVSRLRTEHGDSKIEMALSLMRQRELRQHMQAGS